MSSAQAQPTRAYDFQSGSNAVADNVDTDLNTLYTVLQGGIGDTHIADDAAIAQYKLANSMLGYAEITSDFSDSSSSGISTIVDITGLSVTVTVPAGSRRIKITGYSRQQQQNTSAAQLLLFIRESSTTLNVSAVDAINTSSACPAFVQYIGTPSAGSHTYKLSYSKSAAGTYTLTAGATFPAFILVETF